MNQRTDLDKSFGVPALEPGWGIEGVGECMVPPVPPVLIPPDIHLRSGTIEGRKMVIAEGIRYCVGRREE